MCVCVCDLSEGGKSAPMSEAGRSENVHVAMFEFMRSGLLCLRPGHLQLQGLEVGRVFDAEVHLGLDAIQSGGLLKPEV